MTLCVFQSTPSGGKATVAHMAWESADKVSIHAFRGEGDTISRAAVPCSRQIL